MSATAAGRRPRMLRAAGLAMIALGIAATAGLVVWAGAGTIGGAVWRALPALPFVMAVHAMQLCITGLGWWCLIPAPRPPAWRIMKARWIREAVNTLLPLGGLSGAVAATRVVAREARLPTALATATVTADLTCEAAALAPFLAAALAMVALLAPGKLSPARAALAILPILAGAAGFLLAQRAGIMRLVEKAARALGFGGAMDGLHDSLMALHTNRAQIARAFLLQTTAWCLGSVESWIALRAIGHPVGPATAFAMEGLGMAGRSLGFALPAGLAAQEAGFVLAGSLLGVAAPDAVALSMVKRVRELVVGVAGVAAWQWGEWRG